jgi:hypothetical protein
MSGLDNTSYTVRTVTGTAGTATNNDSVLVFTNTNAKTLALPNPTLVQPGRKYTVINTAGGTLTVSATGGANVNGAATSVLAATTGRAEYISDGTVYWAINIAPDPA